ncbi:hypothetical protein, partial [Paraburkholderia sp. DGU8]|uniref:hypothetical protein n=1 Tax=Paraburkholderia sp. DGU8 TaxID=3161997 RepID=UPI003466CF22
TYPHPSLSAISESLYYFFLIVKERQPIAQSVIAYHSDWLNRQCLALCVVTEHWALRIGGG